MIEEFLSNIDSILLNGTQLILNKVFDLIGFDQIKDEVLKHLVTARLSQPMSKAATVDHLKSHFDEGLQLHKIYRYLDKLGNSQQELIQQISVEHTRKILGGNIGLVFYDVTTLYFESDYSDGFRETGFSKDGKHSQPQIVLGLLVSRGGYPLSYSLFSGSQYEGRTMIPIIEDFVHRSNLEDFVVVADSGLMNKSNLELLEQGEYKYIIGARVKNERVVERAFRVTKGTLEMRPMFHFSPVRIEAHVCICFVAYKVYKELERILRLKQINFSVDKVLSIAKTITTIKVNLPTSGTVMSKTMILNEQHRSIVRFFDENFWKSF